MMSSISKRCRRKAAAAGSVFLFNVVWQPEPDGGNPTSHFISDAISPPLRSLKNPRKFYSEIVSITVLYGRKRLLGMCSCNPNQEESFFFPNRALMNSKKSHTGVNLISEGKDHEVDSLR